MYFTQVHEDAIVEYCLEHTTFKRRSQLYEDLIQPAFSEMVDKIVYTYRFTTLPNIDELRDDCKVWLTTILAKYDPNRGSKAFSYFSVITKNWFIHQVKKNSKRARREVDFDLVAGEVYDKVMMVEDEYHHRQEQKEFWEQLWSEIESWDSKQMSENEKKVYDAVKILLNSIEDIEIFNKKAVYLYLRELTGLSTKQIVSQLNKMRKKYRVFRSDWDNGKI
jgi:DNA-directed RNA polymerase specialized sigma24 family protein